MKIIAVVEMVVKEEENCLKDAKNREKTNNNKINRALYSHQKDDFWCRFMFDILEKVLSNFDAR